MWALNRIGDTWILTSLVLFCLVSRGEGVLCVLLWTVDVAVKRVLNGCNWTLNNTEDTWTLTSCVLFCLVSEGALCCFGSCLTVECTEGV